MQQQEMMQARGMGGMHGGMMGEKSIVSSNDGGAIVMAGSKLYKYDKNLNLVKEVELPKPEGAMHDAAMAGKKSSGCGCAGGCGAAAAQSAPGAAQK